MDFEWDDVKAHSNEKHSISFLEASEVFGDKHSLCVHDPEHSINEERFLLFGLSLKGNCLVVSFAERVGKIRIISARQMTRQERKAYEQ